MIVTGNLIGSRYDNATFDNFRVNEFNRRAYTACLGVANGCLGGVVIMGGSGVGKTHLLVATARKFDRQFVVTDEGHILSKGNVIEFWPARDLVSEIFSSGREVIQRCSKCDLFILDDFGADRDNEYITENIDNIFDTRYRHSLPSAIATNLSSKEIADRYGTRTISRLAETCSIVKISDKEEDHRLAGGSDA